MQFVAKLLGRLFELIRGPGVTAVRDGDTVCRRVSLTMGYGPRQFEIISRRVVYETRFNRWWVPSCRKATFEVQGHTTQEGVNDTLEALTATMTFPDLSAFGLRETAYPHMRAIGAYLDRVAASGIAIKV